MLVAVFSKSPKCWDKMASPGRNKQKVFFNSPPMAKTLGLFSNPGGKLRGVGA